ncbi:hypothetical protein M0804_008784 [Polistes exclamans]|nr:hypothetical protein M0804_008784 [Polistes exclamans]
MDNLLLKSFKVQNAESGLNAVTPISRNSSHFLELLPIGQWEEQMFMVTFKGRLLSFGLWIGWLVGCHRKVVCSLFTHFPSILPNKADHGGFKGVPLHYLTVLNHDSFPPIL